MTDKEAGDELYAVVRDEGERIRAFVTMLSSYAETQHDEWDPIMIMLREIDTRLERLVSLACEEGHGSGLTTKEVLERAVDAAYRGIELDGDDETVLGNRRLLNAVVDMLRKGKRAVAEPVPEAELDAADAVLGKATVLALLQVETAAEPI